MNYYRTNFAIVHVHKWGSFEELDQMMPYERDVYKALLIDHLKQENERAREDMERNKQIQARLNSQIKAKSRGR